MCSEAHLPAALQDLAIGRDVPLHRIVGVHDVVVVTGRGLLVGDAVAGAPGVEGAELLAVPTPVALQIACSPWAENSALAGKQSVDAKAQPAWAPWAGVATAVRGRVPLSDAGALNRHSPSVTVLCCCATTIGGIRHTPSASAASNAAYEETQA